MNVIRLLCFSDLHRDRQAARALVERAGEVDLVVGAGDFANRHEGLADTLDILSEIPTPTVLVPGNGETVTELEDATRDWNAATVLHGQGTTVAGSDLPIWGVGGGIPVTPFGDWSYDFDEVAGAELLADCPAAGILVTHSPPLDTVDHDSSGRIRGSQAIRNTVDQRQPVVVISGHIHSDWTKHVRIGNTLVLNAGPTGIRIDIHGDHAKVVGSP